MRWGLPIDVAESKTQSYSDWFTEDTESLESLLPYNCASRREGRSNGSWKFGQWTTLLLRLRIALLTDFIMSISNSPSSVIQKTFCTKAFSRAIDPYMRRRRYH